MKITTTGLGLAAALGTTFAATASLTTITFEADPSGPVPDGFVSFDSPLVSFSNSFGLGLAIGDYGIASDGQALAVGDNDTSALVMNFSTLMDFISMDFGNDDPLLSAPGDTAILTVFLAGDQVGQTVVLLNRNEAMDQNIAFGGAQFDSATVEYYVTGDGLTKVVDNITFNTVPLPGALAVIGLAGFAVRTRRR